MTLKEKFLAGHAFRFMGKEYAYEKLNSGASIIVTLISREWVYHSNIEKISDDEFTTFNFFFDKKAKTKLKFKDLEFLPVEGGEAS